MKIFLGVTLADDEQAWYMRHDDPSDYVRPPVLGDHIAIEGEGPPRLCLEVEELTHYPGKMLHITLKPINVEPRERERVKERPRDSVHRRAIVIANFRCYSSARSYLLCTNN